MTAASTAAVAATATERGGETGGQTTVHTTETETETETGTVITALAIGIMTGRRGTRTGVAGVTATGTSGLVGTTMTRHEMQTRLATANGTERETTMGTATRSVATMTTTWTMTDTGAAGDIATSDLRERAAAGRAHPSLLRRETSDGALPRMQTAAPRGC